MLRTMALLAGSALNLSLIGCSVETTASASGETAQSISANDYYTTYFGAESDAALTAEWQSLHNVRILELYSTVLGHASDAPVTVSGVTITNIATRLRQQRTLATDLDRQYQSYGAYLEAQGFNFAMFSAPVTVADVANYVKNRAAYQPRTALALTSLGTRAVVPVTQNLAGQDCPGSHGELRHIVPGGKLPRSAPNPDAAPVEERIAARLTNYLTTTVGDSGPWVYPPMVFLPYEEGEGPTAETLITAADQIRSVKNLAGANEDSSWFFTNAAGQGNFEYISSQPPGVLIRDSTYINNCFKTVYLSF